MCADPQVSLIPAQSSRASRHRSRKLGNLTTVGATKADTATASLLDLETAFVNEPVVVRAQLNQVL
jgi:hypothetical protein